MYYIYRLDIYTTCILVYVYIYIVKFTYHSSLFLILLFNIESCFIVYTKYNIYRSWKCSDNIYYYFLGVYVFTTHLCMSTYVYIMFTYSCYYCSCSPYNSNPPQSTATHNSILITSCLNTIAFN